MTAARPESAIIRNDQASLTAWRPRSAIIPNDPRSVTAERPESKIIRNDRASMTAEPPETVNSGTMLPICLEPEQHREPIELIQSGASSTGQTDWSGSHPRGSRPPGAELIHPGLVARRGLRWGSRAKGAEGSRLGRLVRPGGREANATPRPCRPADRVAPLCARSRPAPPHASLRARLRGRAAGPTRLAAGCARSAVRSSVALAGNRGFRPPSGRAGPSATASPSVRAGRPLTLP